MNMNNKKAMEMAISTIILIVIGILVLIGLIYLLNLEFGFFSNHVESLKASDVDSVVNSCNSFVSSQSIYSYCCNKNIISVSGEKLNLTCQELKTKNFTSNRIQSIDCSVISCK